jgi:hypothetical protein
VIVGNFSSGRNILISKTKPLYDDSNNVIGVFAHTKDVTNSGIFNRYMNLIVDGTLCKTPESSLING